MECLQRKRHALLEIRVLPIGCELDALRRSVTRGNGRYVP
ncbi:Hypothetical protein AA314_02663 [Archangium gephyra]|uniref:Uncharacterized protein n=1 Tax=Archangium gephyra TaxID=48 RepID=A0AAC8TCI3_9BACT|nr:Hypothetical protein AA314_02663 [Archangium gephyra]